MLPASIIVKKRDGGRLSKDELAFMIDGFLRGDVLDYQISALAMAICWRGLDAEETAALTSIMHHSGQSLPRDSGQTPRVDKHSTGGLGDKVSLIFAPLLASCGVHVPMISGRGLGITGGTLDKLESIGGLSVQYDIKDTQKLLEQCGCFIIGANLQIAPADRRLYSLRDVTGTVESTGLIAASILSKKLAASLDALVMDVKVGCGAFMHTLEDADELAKLLVSTGASADLPVRALVSDMNQPLGTAVGNAIEVNEALSVLAGEGPTDVRDLTLQLGAHALAMIGAEPDEATAMQVLQKKLDGGDAMEQFQRMVVAQGGHLEGPLDVHPAHEIVAAEEGIVQRVHCRLIGQDLVALGGGRSKVGDNIDHRVGLEMHVRIGQRVEAGQPLATLHCDSDGCSRAAEELQSAFILGSEAVDPTPLVHRVITAESESASSDNSPSGGRESTRQEDSDVTP